MTRRLLIVTTVLTVTAGVGGSALASDTDANSHGVCVGLSQSHNGPLDGVCVWIPTDKAAH